MRALVIGGNSYIGKRLVEELRKYFSEVVTTTRRPLPDGSSWKCDLLDLGAYELPRADVVYICAAMTRFIECEDKPEAYRINVDAPINIARAYPEAKIVYLSSEAVERALHTNYGMHKALAEMGLRTVCDPVIVRLSKVDPHYLDRCCAYLAELANQQPGIYHWP